MTARSGSDVGMTQESFRARLALKDQLRSGTAQFHRPTDRTPSDTSTVESRIQLG